MKNIKTIIIILLIVSNAIFIYAYSQQRSASRTAHETAEIARLHAEEAEAMARIAKEEAMRAATMAQMAQEDAQVQAEAMRKQLEACK